MDLTSFYTKIRRVADDEWLTRLGLILQPRYQTRIRISRGGRIKLHVRRAKGIATLVFDGYELWYLDKQSFSCTYRRLTNYRLRRLFCLSKSQIYKIDQAITDMYGPVLLDALASILKREYPSIVITTKTLHRLEIEYGDISFLLFILADFKVYRSITTIANRSIPGELCSYIQATEKLGGLLRRRHD